MKKIFVFFTLAILSTLTSCDSNDNNDSKSVNFLKATINGTEVVFDTYNVEKIDNTEEGYSDIIITATKSNDPSKTITIGFEYLATGVESCYSFQYIDEDTYYSANPRENTSLTVDITENIPNKTKGNFSGTVAQEEGVGTVVIENGTFEIDYKVK